MSPEREKKILATLKNRQPDLAVVLDNVHDPHNIFAVMRTCDAVGIQDIYLVNAKFKDERKQGKKSSSGALKWLNVHHFADIHSCMEVVREKYDKIYATHLGVASKSLYELNLTESVALVFGNEHAGVSDACLTYCDGNFIIPQVGMVVSLNISVACAISLYEAYRQRSLLGYYNELGRMPEEEQKKLARIWKIYDEIHLGDVKN
jgi:tRNA (guanosine-2'-O-)-methyltransferase